MKLTKASLQAAFAFSLLTMLNPESLVAQPPVSAGQTQQSEEPLPAKRREEIKFKHSSFTFARVKYSVNPANPGHSRERWAIDYPQCDQRFSAWFEQKTGLKTDPNGVAIELIDSRLKDYPFLYLVEPGHLSLSKAEATALRGYLLKGGFLMMDDFWGEREWTNVVVEMKKVFPERESVELQISHEIFHCYYDIHQKPQVPNLFLGIQSQYSGITWERADAKEPHFRGIFDDRGRLMVMLCHNTDLGDGWEHEGENEFYSKEFSRKKAYPMGINIVVYALTH